MKTDGKYVKITKILDYDDSIIVKLIETEKWNSMVNEKEKILAIYNFVRDKILFGYNTSDNISASQVLKDGYGQCNTKTNLLMALFRACGIECRFRGFTIDKRLQKGALTGITYKLSPKEIIHSWVQVKYNDNWYDLEGVIIDKKYLTSIQKKFSGCNGQFCAFGIATENLQNPQIEWNENNTYIQNKGIARDFGTFDSPDEFYEKYGTNIRGFKKFLWLHLFRKLVNNNIDRIRKNIN
jgi:hypothetical protein